MRKTWVSIVLASAVTAGSIVGVGLTGNGRSVEAAAKPSFSDISGHWAESSIETAVKAGILNGYSDGTYKPNSTITRAELLKVMALTFKLEVGSGGAAWYTPYQTALSKAGVYMDGDYPGNLNNPATRNEMAKLAVRGEYADYRNKKLTAAELMFRAVNKGILSRSGTKAETINTEGTTTRAEAAVLVTRLLKLANGGTLTVDQGASSAAEIAWHRNNMITMFNQDDLVKFPYSVKINDNYQVTIDRLIVLDPTDKNGYLSEYLEGATYFFDDKYVKATDGYVFAYKLIGKNLKVIQNYGLSIGASSFYMYAEKSGVSGGAGISEKYWYSDGKVIDRPGLFTNRTELDFSKANNVGYDFNIAYFSHDYIKSQISQYGAFPIHLERFGNQMNAKSQFYLTDVRDKLWQGK